MRADRLLSLLLLLQTRGRMTAQALAEQLEVSERTIYRDIEALSFAGIPLYTERGPGGGCELLDGYQTRLTGLTEPEVRALFLLSAFAPLADLSLDQALEDALLKLCASLPAPSREHAAQVRQRIYLDTTRAMHSRPGISHLEVLQTAIWHDYTLRLTYGGYHRRSVDPYGLVSRSGVWYLIGASAGIMQVVRVAHILVAELTEQHFSRPPEFDLATYWAEYVSLMNRAPAGGRGNRITKKTSMKAGASTHPASQRGPRIVLARNKKKAFYLSRLFSVHSLPQKRERIPFLIMAADGGSALENLATQLFWDFHYLMNNEMTYLQVPVFIANTFNTFERGKLQAIDAFARLMQQPDENFAQLQTIWETNRDFRLLYGSLV